MASPEPKPSPWGVVAVENRLASCSMDGPRAGEFARTGRPDNDSGCAYHHPDRLEGPRLRVVGRLIAARSSGR